MQTVEDADISAYPVIVLNVDGLSLGEAHSPSEYVTIWNSNAANQAHGTLFVGTGAFCFYLKKKNSTTPPSNVLGGVGIPPASLEFKYGFTSLDTTGEVPTEKEYQDSVDAVFTAVAEQTGTFSDGGTIKVTDFANTADKVLFIQVPASQALFTMWSEVGNPLQQNRPVDPAYSPGSALFFKTTRLGQSLYITRYQTSFTGAVVLSR